MNQVVYAAALRALRLRVLTRAGARSVRADLDDGALTPEFAAAARRALEERAEAEAAKGQR